MIQSVPVYIFEFWYMAKGKIHEMADRIDERENLQDGERNQSVHIPGQNQNSETGGSDLDVKLNR